MQLQDGFCLFPYRGDLNAYKPAWIRLQGFQRGFLMFSPRSMLIMTLFLLPLVMAFLVIILEATSSIWWELTDFILEGRRGLTSLARRLKP